MPTSPLPENPSLENLRKQAKRLLDQLRGGDATAQALLAEFHPRPPDAPALHDAQLVLARSHGFPSWARLVHHLDGVERHAWDPRETPRPSDPAQLVPWLACLDYGRWRLADLDAAAGALAAHPEVTRASIHAAAAAGDVAAVRALIGASPALVGTRGGPYGWPPLLYACYSRLDRDTLGAVRALLDAGADPDAGFLWCGNVPPFTALTGAFGGGEAGNNYPPHPRAVEVARALLDAGADPNDGQTLYNRHFLRDDTHLVLLFEYGLGTDRGGPWLARFGERLGTPEDLLVEELWAAARLGYLERVRLLVERGAPVDRRGRRDGRTPYEGALERGNREVAAYLMTHGAKPIAITPEQELAAAVLAAERDEVTAILARVPDLRDRLGPAGRVGLVMRSVESHRPEAVRLLAELGFELDYMIENTPMHQAAWTGDVDMVRLLVELGASTTGRDPCYHSTPLGWAHFNKHHHVVEYLMPMATIFDAMWSDHPARVRALLAADPALATATDHDGDSIVFYLHRDQRNLPELIDLLRSHGARFDVHHHGGATWAEHLRGRGDDAVVAAVLGAST